VADPTYSFLTQKYRTRGQANVPNYADLAEEMPGMTQRGEVLIAPAVPERMELVRLGAGFSAQIPTASAFTFVAAWPTTRAELVLWNGEASGGKTYVIDRVWLANITSQAAAQPYSLLGQIAPTTLAIAAPTDNTAVLRQNLLGKSTAFNSNARLMLANTAFALANHWFTLGQGVMAPMTTNLGASMEAVVYGKYLIPPGAAFCVAGLAGTAAGTAICGIEWYEVQLTLP
jgi:hypothetical protein